jgi:hypothetical protein
MLIISSNVSCSRHNIAEQMGHLSLSNTNPSLIKNNLLFTVTSFYFHSLARHVYYYYTNKVSVFLVYKNNKNVDI